jgi:hypothetical protein
MKAHEAVPGRQQVKEFTCGVCRLYFTSVLPDDAFTHHASAALSRLSSIRLRHLPSLMMCALDHIALELGEWDERHDAAVVDVRSRDREGAVGA